MPATDTAGTQEALPDALQGKERYTYADYAHLPEGAPYELIHGHLVRSPSPTPHHQIIQATLQFALTQFARNTGNGLVLSAPMDVRLDAHTVVQPDLMFITEDQRSILGEQNIEGAPALIVEILSPSTAGIDLSTKKRLYETHGVREYWTVDPETQAVEVHVNTAHGFDQHARVVESGTVASALLDGFALTITDLF